MVELIGERVMDRPESDIPSVETLESNTLREIAREAGKSGSESKWVARGSSEQDAKDAIPKGIHQEFESLPSDDDGSYVTVDGVPVLLRLEITEFHGDIGNASDQYYVDSHAVRQYDDGTDPMRGTLLECQP